MFSVLLPFAWPAAAVAVVVTCLFVVATVRKNNGLADIAWGPILLIAAVTAAYVGRGFGPTAILATTLVTVWALRLAIRIARRNRGKGEDFRYAAWRKAWGKWATVRSYFQVFLLQGLFALTVVSPVILLQAIPDPGLRAWSWVGAGVWVLGFVFEAVGDAQLDAFISDKTRTAKVLETGLWKYTRHPNYFGEATMWWGLGIIAYGAGVGPVAFVGPFVITYLVRFVSGVPLVEEKLMQDPAFQAYAKRTSVFLPWFSKKA